MARSREDDCELQDAAELKLDPKCELFRKGDPNLETVSTLNDWWMPISSTLFFGGFSLFHNWMNRRPPLSSAPRTALYGTLGLAFGLWFRNFRYKWTAENDLWIYEYMRAHPEDFQAPERVKYRDYLTKWYPIR